MPQILLIFADSSLSYIPSPVKKYNNLGLDETWKVTKCKKASKVTIACSTNGDIIGGLDDGMASAVCPKFSKDPTGPQEPLEATIPKNVKQDTSWCNAVCLLFFSQDLALAQLYNI